MAHKRWGKCLTAAALAAMIALTSGISAPAWAESISELESQQESLQTRSGELNAALEEAKKNRNMRIKSARFKDKSIP